MTIVASVKVRDGIVLGTDSMTQLSSPTGWVKSYANARKLFQLGDLPIGIMSYGLGNVGDRSIEGLIRDFRRDKPMEDVSVGDAAHALYDYVRPLYDAELPNPDPDQHALGFFVAGYSPGGAFAEEFEFLLPSDTAPTENQPSTTVGTAWRGIGVPFTSLCRGMSPGVFAELQALGIPDADLLAMMDRNGMIIAQDGMPMQDAINLATYVLDVTIGWATFQIGPASCGRPLQIAVVTPDNGWEWVARPKLEVTQP